MTQPNKKKNINKTPYNTFTHITTALYCSHLDLPTWADEGLGRL